MSKIKDSNDLLGLIITENKNNNSDAHAIFLKSNIDATSFRVLLNALIQHNYVTCNLSEINVTSLGNNNFISKFKKFSRFLAVAIKEVIVFVLGIVSGVVGTLLSSYLSDKF